MTRTTTPALFSLLLGSLACNPYGLPDPSETEGSETDDSDGTSDTEGDEFGGPPLDGPPTLDAPCVLGPEAPTRLVVTTTDFATGAVSVIDAGSGDVTADVALGSTDAIPFHHGEHVFLLHRFMVDALDVLDADGDWSTLSQQALTTDDDTRPSANAHSVAFADDGLAHVTLFAAPAVQTFDLSDPAAPTRLHGRTIDLSPVADDDGNPEASLSIVCGDTLFVSVGWLDENATFSPTTDHDGIVAIDRTSGRLHDLDPETPGVQTLTTGGQWARQWRLDPADPARHTVLVLTTGLERVDLAAGTRAWAVPPETLESVGIDHPMLPQAFVVDAAGETAFIAAYQPGLSSVTIYRVGIDGGAPQTPEAIAEGLNSVDRVLERVGDTLWYGDTTPGHAGVLALDLTANPPAPLFAEPLPVGLAPYSMIAIP